MSEIMQKRCTERKQRVRFIPMLVCLEVEEDAPYDFVDTKGMIEPAVLCTVEGQIRRAQLLDSAQTLEFRRCDQVPDDAVTHMHIAMHRVLEHLLFMKFFVFVRHMPPNPFLFDPFRYSI